MPAQGLALWVRGDRGIYMTPGAAAVCAWADQSGHGRILGNAGPGRPVWMPLAVGGKPGVHFGSTATSLATAGAVGIAALLDGLIEPEGPVVVVVSGRNIAIEQHLRVITEDPCHG